MRDDGDGRARRYEHRRGEILDAATTHVLERGVGDLSLRRVAQAAGISHATLLHHFRTRDELVAEVVDMVVASALAVPDLAEDDPDPITALWRRATSETGSRYVRLFLELSGMSMYSRSPVHAALARSMRERCERLAEGMRRAGCPAEESRPLATLTLAGMRGLLEEMFVTEDRERIEAGFRQLHAMVEARATTWS